MTLLKAYNNSQRCFYTNYKLHLFIPEESLWASLEVFETITYFYLHSLKIFAQNGMQEMSGHYRVHVWLQGYEVTMRRAQLAITQTALQEIIAADCPVPTVCDRDLGSYSKSLMNLSRICQVKKEQKSEMSRVSITIGSWNSPAGRGETTAELEHRERISIDISRQTHVRTRQHEQKLDWNVLGLDWNTL